ncbi:MAG: energy-dependent translational throttle protein EttA [Kiritimatiellae bacterium]|nr:energy-dependent translational throttle protein EttA [Kiritimatiellia bacterium]
MPGEYVFSLERMTKQYGSTMVLDNISLAFFFGAKIGVIGGNGSGKSSLLRILAGLDTEILGQARIARQVKVGYLSQEPQLDNSRTVAENVNDGAAAAQAVVDRYDAVCEQLGADLPRAESEKLNAELGRLQETIERFDLWELDHSLEMAMEALRLPPGDSAVTHLSGGERRRVALCRLLVSAPDVLLLDEPTNHLDADSVAWLEQYLVRFPGTLVVVTHDRYFLNNVTEWILELEGTRAIPFKGNYEAWLAQKEALLERDRSRQVARRKLIQQELAWVRMSPAGRHAKGKARLKRYDELVAQQVDTREDNLEIQIPPGPRLGELVVRARNLTKAYGDRLLMENVEFDLPRGGIVGVIGGNGAGKTTLLRMITGEEQPSAGELTVGPTVKLAYVDQSRDSLDGAHTVYEEISGGEETLELGGRRMNSRAYCNRFNFRGADQQKRVGDLSGGERNRVHLAKLLRGGGNLLLLDEPTNDLDVTTLRALEEGLTSFGGCAVLVSHDRWFLDRVATHLLVFEGESTVSWFEGNYQAYHEQQRRLLGDRADQPRRVRFRPVSPA